MPYRWNETETKAPYLPQRPANGAPLATLTLWPHRSLPNRGFAWVIGLMFVLLMIPLMGLIGTVFLWVIAPCGLAALAGLWVALRASDRTGLGEHLELRADNITLTRTNPKGPPRTWTANPYWVRLSLHPDGGPVEQYLTLKGDGREVELGAFLSPEERVQLRDELAFVLGQLPR